MKHGDKLTAQKSIQHQYVYLVTQIEVWIDRIRLPILLVVSWTGKLSISLSPFAPEVSQDGFGSPV